MGVLTAGYERNSFAAHQNDGTNQVQGRHSYLPHPGRPTPEGLSSKLNTFWSGERRKCLIVSNFTSRYELETQIFQ